MDLPKVSITTVRPGDRLYTADHASGVTVIDRYPGSRATPIRLRIRLADDTQRILPVATVCTLGYVLLFRPGNLGEQPIGSIA